MRGRHLLLSTLGALLILSPRPSEAQDSMTVEYAVKIVCGTPNLRQLAAGVYFTAINIHNPNRDSVLFRKKFALTLPEEQPGRVSPFTKGLLMPDQALEIDCNGVFRYTGARFAKGFAVIQSPQPLDVVAVYTAAGSTGRVETMELERVPARRLLAGPCQGPDLVVDTIMRPTWDAANNRSVIQAVIRNIGSALAPPTLARVIDPSTLQSTGAPYNAIANTPPLMQSGGSATVTFYLPYWVFNPDATLEVTADYKNDLVECREDNNMKKFEAIG